MRITIGKRMGLGFGVVLCLVATLAIVVLFHLDRIHRQFSFVIEHDAPVIANARQLLRLVVDMETGQRGFVITGKQEFLEPYENARSEFRDLVNDEKILVSDNPSQVKRMEKIEASLQEWLIKAAQPEIAMRRKIGEATVDAHRLQEILSQGVGKRLMDSIMRHAHDGEVAFSERGYWEGAFTAEAIEKCMTDREDGQRGFLITGKEEFLEKYNAGEQLKLPEYFARLREIGAEKNIGKEIIDKIDLTEQLTFDWDRKAAIPEIAARRSMNEKPETLQDVADMLEVGTGKRILDRIRADFEQFISEEERLTAERFASATTAAKTTRNTTIMLTLASLVFGGVMGLVITLGITNPVRKLANALKMVAKGDLDQEIQIKSNDEIGELSISFNQMTKTLRETSAELEKDATLKSAQANLAALMQDANNLEELGDTVTELIANYTGSQMGAFYVRPLGEGEGEGYIHLLGSYAFPGRERSVCKIETGEDLVSQVARSKSAILISDLPEDYVKVSSGLGEALPRQVLVVPMLEGTRLKGVIELGSFRGFSDEQIADVEVLIQPVAAVIEAKQGAEKIRSLLDASQQQATELSQANEELGETSKDLERQKAAIQERNSALEVVRRDVEEKAQELMLSSQYKTEFLANMSHEIRTPMTAILGFTEIVRDKVTDPESREWLEKIQRNGDHLLGIINDILDISKIESNKLITETIDVSPAQILADVDSLMSVRASGKGITLQVEFDGPIPRNIKTDPTRLRQILVNITGNAIKFTEVGGVRLVARVLDPDSDEPKMMFDIVDTGIGLTEDHISNLFQPFVQADTSITRKFGGTGLGLTISKRLSEMLGGGIKVQSDFGKGSTFSLIVSTGPLKGVKMVNSPAEAKAFIKPASAAESEDVRLDCRVLLAEDSPDNQRLISFILKKAGAEVAIAKNGQIAIDLAMKARDEENTFDVILMDMQMPVLDGYSATTKLREEGYTGPIIALTAHAMNSDRDKCLAAGCDDYTTKPINRKQLIALVAQYASQQDPCEELSIGS